MVEKKKSKLVIAKWPLSCIMGLVIIIFCWVTVLISMALAPPSFTPLTNYLSSLGNLTYNPKGAVLYNISVIISGILFQIFFLGLSLWNLETLFDKILLRGNQIVGTLLSIVLILTGVYSEDFKTAHVFWAIVAGILGFVVNVFLAVYIFIQKESNRKISYTIFILMGSYVILLFILSPQNVLTEWVVRALGDVSLILMIYNLNHIYQERNRN